MEWEEEENKAKEKDDMLGKKGKGKNKKLIYTGGFY